MVQKGARLRQIQQEGPRPRKRGERGRREGLWTRDLLQRSGGKVERQQLVAALNKPRAHDVNRAAASSACVWRTKAIEQLDEMTVGIAQPCAGKQSRALRVR